MKRLFIVFTMLALCCALQAQTFSLTVDNGYGSGNYNAGDTVHIWAKEFPANSVYDKWTGNVSTVQRPEEWHTTLVMPSADVSVTANFRSVPTYNIVLDTIQGQVIPKPVYYYFPTSYYGVIYFFHGTGGSAKGWINNVENRQMVNQAIGDSFAVIITEADEATTGVDANSDGKLRWLAYPLDSVGNVDYANIKAITDTFINRGLMTHSTKRYSIGMSNGGGFSSTCSALLGFDAGVSYCASGASALFSVSTVPFLFCMANYDSNQEVGSAGNADAFANSNQLISRNVCSKYYLHDRSPVYPERFVRIPGVTLTQSQDLLTDLSSNNLVDANNYVIVPLDTIVQRYTTNPSFFPGLNALTGNQKSEALNQIASCYADHQFYSDYNALSLNFLKNYCDTVTTTPSAVANVFAQDRIAIFPNPTSSTITLSLPIDSDFEIEIMDVTGAVVMKTRNEKIVDILKLDKGIYLVQVKSAGDVYVQKVIKE